MKRISCTLGLPLILLVSIHLFGQKPVVELTFTASKNAGWIPLDSIKVTNLTRGGDTLLVYPDTVLSLQDEAGFENPEVGTDRGFILYQNHPNPFRGETSVGLYIPRHEQVSLCVFNLLGRKIGGYTGELEPGHHNFTFTPGKDRLYLLAAFAANTSASIKMICLQEGEDHTCRLLYAGRNNGSHELKTCSTIAGFHFAVGDTLKFGGYTGTGLRYITDHPDENKSYEFSFIMGIPCPDFPTITYEGQVYNTVQIGTQCWLKENLNVGTMITGNYQTNNGLIEKYCYSDNPANCLIYGGLYQWDEMMKYSVTPGVKGICPPSGEWHIPTDAEWCTLEKYIEPDITCYSSGSHGIYAGGKLKEEGTGHWLVPNSGASNLTGFTALPGGHGYSLGYQHYSSLTYAGEFLTSSMTYSKAWTYALHNNTANIYRLTVYPYYGYSVRCMAVVDNQAPLAPFYPGPPNNSSSLPISTWLSWKCSDPDNDALTYDVYFGPVNPPPLVMSGLATANFDPDTLSYITKYYWKIVAHDNHGNLTEGPVWSFTTRADATWVCAEYIFDDRNHRVYPTVMVEPHCWMAKNLDIGDMILPEDNQTNNKTIEKYCYNNVPDSCDYYGGLYQWGEMMQYGPSGSQGICPEGWHLPSDEEWCTSEQYLDPTIDCISMVWRGTDGGGKLKEAGTKHWQAPNTGATNASGFRALAGGYVHDDQFFDLLSKAYFFSSTSYLSRQLGYNTPRIYRGAGVYTDAMSARCIKDPLPTVNTSNISNISFTTAMCGGAVTDEGMSPVTERGVCWSTSWYPTVNDPHTHDGGGTGAFSSQLAYLSPSTTYYVRAYATNQTGTAYGSMMSFKTLSILPVIFTVTITNITGFTATGGGHVTDEGQSPVTARGVCWNTTPNPTLDDSHTLDGSGAGEFVSQITGLTPGITYYVRAYATNEAGTAYGNQVNFTTLTLFPVVSTTSISNISYTTATGGGNVTSAGAYPVTARGICWSTSQNPTLNDPHTVDGSGSGLFVSQLSGLAPGITYYVRAYATNQAGTAYGNQVVFATITSCPGIPTVTYGGQVYNTILIGIQCWLKENLNIGTMINGNSSQTNNGVIEKYCYNNSTANCDIYGGLYQWHEMMQYTNIPGTKGICPDGWHLPTDAEWCILEQFVDPTITCNSTSWRGVDGGGKLKEAGTTHWAQPNTGATNSIGFTALPGGWLEGSGFFAGLSQGGYLWTSSESGSYAWYRTLYYTQAKVARGYLPYSRGFMVRCVKD